MQRVLASFLALGLAAATGTAAAQSYGGYDGYPSPVGQGDAAAGGYYDYARVLRVDPVIRSGYRSSGGRCYTMREPYPDPADGYGNTGGYRDGNGYYRNDGYAGGGYGSGSTVGRNVATIVGGVVGAALGSQVGGGSARYATSAIGSMVGGMAGRQVYDSAHRPTRVASVQMCDPVSVGQAGYNGGDTRYYGNDYGTGYDANDVDGYDVAYEYAGRTYTTRTRYNPGSRIRVRVDVHPE